jgi:hypothetical protein
MNAKLTKKRSLAVRRWPKEMGLGVGEKCSDSEQ